MHTRGRVRYTLFKKTATLNARRSGVLNTSSERNFVHKLKQLRTGSEFPSRNSKIRKF